MGRRLALVGDQGRVALLEHGEVVVDDLVDEPLAGPQAPRVLAADLVVEVVDDDVAVVGVDGVAHAAQLPGRQGRLARVRAREGAARGRGLGLRRGGGSRPAGWRDGARGRAGALVC